MTLLPQIFRDPLDHLVRHGIDDLLDPGRDLQFQNMAGGRADLPGEYFELVGMTFLINDDQVRGVIVR